MKKIPPQLFFVPASAFCVCAACGGKDFELFPTRCFRKCKKLRTDAQQGENSFRTQPSFFVLGRKARGGGKSPAGTTFSQQSTITIPSHESTTYTKARSEAVGAKRKRPRNGALPRPQTSAKESPLAMNPKIKQLLETCKAAAPSCVFKIYDSEAFVIKTADISAALAAMDGGDDIAEITVKDGKTVLGWFACMPYGDEDEAVYDYADNEFCNRIFESL